MQIIFCNCTVSIMPETLPVTDKCDICGGPFQSGEVDLPRPTQPFSWGPLGFLVHPPLPERTE